jgi:3-phosphoshikimate 1-carboxyvinyltransferase
MLKTIFPGQVGGTISAPVSKSYAQRAIAAALLAEGDTKLYHMGLCDDTAAAMEVARRLGARIYYNDRYYIIRGGLFPRAGVLNVGESGLSTRLFTPIAALFDYPVTVTGHGSILGRPIAAIENPLRKLGAKIDSNNGYLPLMVQGPLRGGEISIDGSQGSQFLTGLLMALPMAEGDSTIRVRDLKSKPYIDMTIEVARAFGVEIVHENYEVFRLRGSQSFVPTEYSIEGDWSGASCLLVAGAIAGQVTVKNLRQESLQADRLVLDALRAAGAGVAIGEDGEVTVSKGTLKGFSFDAGDCPDLFPALVALAACCSGRTVLKGTGRLTHKESDRAAVLAEVFTTLGIRIDRSKADTMIIEGGTIRGGRVSSHNDHRIAMAAAVAGLAADAPVEIDDAEAVSKSYPDFWDDLELIRSGQ